jgi:2-hydroxychromene-2-carboxylate isomerase
MATTPNTGLYRKGGSVFETAQESLAALSGGAPTPTTPAGASAVGGTPQQAAMAGTPAQKKPVVQAAVAPTESLQTQQRQVAASTAPPVAESPGAVAAAKADRLRALGSLNSRVENLLASRLGKVTKATVVPEVDTAALADLFPDAKKQKAVKKALTAYATGGYTEAGLAAVANAAGLESLAADEINKMFLQGGQAFAGAADNAALGATTVNNLNLAKITDVNQLAADLGMTPEALKALPLDQFKQMIEDVQAREFQAAASLQAELVNATPQRAQEIQAELRTMGQQGVTATEQSVEHLAAEVASDQEIQFNGQTYRIDQLLKDDTVSKTILAAVDSPALLEELKRTQPQLAEWVTNNQKALADVAIDMKADVAAVQAATDAFKTATSGLSEALVGKLLPGLAGKALTTAEVAAAKDTLAKDPLYSFALQTPDLLAQLNTDPTLLDQTKGWTTEQIKAGWEAKQRLDGDADAARVMEGLGIKPGALLSVADADKLRQITKSGLYDLLKSDPAEYQAALQGLSPHQITLLLAMPAKDIKQAHSRALSVEADPLIQALTGIKDTQGFLLPKQWKDVQTALQDPTYQSVSKDKELMAYLQKNPAEVTAALDAYKDNPTAAMHSMVTAAAARRDPVLASIYGFTDEESWRDMNPKDLQKAVNMVGAMTTIRDSFPRKQRGQYGELLQEMADMGVFDRSSRFMDLAENPQEILEAAMAARNAAPLADAMNAANTPTEQSDAALDYLFGEDVDAEEYKNLYDDLRAVSANPDQIKQHLEWWGLDGAVAGDVADNVGNMFENFYSFISPSNNDFDASAPFVTAVQDRLGEAPRDAYQRMIRKGRGDGPVTDELRDVDRTNLDATKQFYDVYREQIASGADRETAVYETVKAVLGLAGGAVTQRFTPQPGTAKPPPPTPTWKPDSMAPSAVKKRRKKAPTDRWGN